jgi:hypothetical protein
MTDEKTPAENFNSDATRRTRLAALLADPVLVEAIDIADDIMRPKAGSITDSNQSLTVAKFHQSAGANEFVRLLKFLTKVPVERTLVKIKTLASTLEDLPKEQ